MDTYSLLLTNEFIVLTGNINRVRGGAHVHKTMVLKYTPKHFLIMMQKSRPKQGFYGILLQIWPP